MKRTPEELPSYNMLQKAITLLEDIAQAVDQAYNKQKQNLEFTEVINEFHDSTVRRSDSRASERVVASVLD